MRIGIVNDLRLAVEALKRLVASVPEAAVAWIAMDGKQAVEACAADVPDLVLMDLVMPVMDGVEATRRIMNATPCPILVVTATVEGNLSRVYDALGAGALDAVQGPTFGEGGALQGAEPVVRKIRMIARLHGARGAGSPAASPPAPRAPEAVPAPSDAPRLVALGASTGGPDALLAVLRGFSRTFEPAVLVVQHLDADFVPGFVEWLRKESRRDVRAAVAGGRPEPRQVLVACSNDHLVVGADRRFRYDAEPADNPYRPSVDVLFSSLAASWPTPGVAAVLTGMGRDGAEGLGRLARAGWSTVAQDQATSVVYGMPRAAREAGAAQAVVALPAIGSRIEAEWTRLASRSAAERPS